MGAILTQTTTISKRHSLPFIGPAKEVCFPGDQDLVEMRGSWLNPSLGLFVLGPRMRLKLWTLLLRVTLAQDRESVASVASLPPS